MEDKDIYDFDKENPVSSPISHLPPEILSRIFIFCLPDNEFPSMSSKVPPILLCQVCAAWREISLGTPQLWSSFRIFGYHSWEFKRQRFLQWLERSGALPLSFEISATDLDMKDYLHNHDFVVDKICSRPDRWRHVNLHAAGILLSFPSLDKLSNALRSAGSLEFLRLVAYNSPNILDLSNLHGLKELHLASGSHTVSFNVSTNHFRYLHTVTLETYASMSRILPLLEGTRYIKHLDIRIHECAPFNSKTCMVELLHLECLNCTFDCSPVGLGHMRPIWGMFFGQLHVPNLHHVYVEVARYSSGDFSVDMELLSQCLSASQHSLVSFGMRYTLFSPQRSIIESLVDCLECLPNLRRLKVGFSLKAQSIDTLLVLALTLRGRPENPYKNLCPLLEEVEFRRCRLASMDDIVQMIGSRAPSQDDTSGVDGGPGTLRRIFIETVDEDQYQDVSDFGKLPFENVKFEVVSGRRGRLEQVRRDG